MSCRHRVYSILLDFFKLHFWQRILILSVDRLVPPFEKGRSWSKCKFSVEPHRMHLPSSLMYTSCLTLLGISLVCGSVLVSAAWSEGVLVLSVSLRMKRKTLRLLSFTVL